MKLKFLWIILLANLMCASSFAQPFIENQKVIGGNNFDGNIVRVAVLKNGGLIVGGSSYSNKSGEKTQNIRGSNDYWIVKLNSNNQIEWDKTIGGIFDDNFKSVIQTSDGGYALIGESTSITSVEKDDDSHGLTDYWIVKLDKKGNVEWDKTIGGSGSEYIDNIVQTSDGGYILAGSSDSYRSGDKTEDSRGFFDYWVVKLDKYGNIQWDKTIGGDNYEFLSGVELTSDGGVVLAGFSLSNMSGEKTENSRGDYDYWIVKLNKEGHIQWDKTIGGSGADFGRGIKQTDEGGYVISGISNSNISGEKTENGRGFFDYWVVQLDKMGNFKKDKTIGGSGDDTEVWCLEKTSDGGYILGGTSNSYI
nr:T9SS C-terminal target domain-containing protein [Bacteroidota bacterium]